MTAVFFDKFILIPQYNCLVRSQSHFLPIPAKRIIIIEYDLVFLYIVRKLVDRSMPAEVGTDEKPFPLVHSAVGDDSSAFVVVFPYFSPHCLFVLLPDPKQFLIEAVYRPFAFQIFLYVDLRVQWIHALP